MLFSLASCEIYGKIIIRGVDFLYNKTVFQEKLEKFAATKISIIILLECVFFSLLLLLLQNFNIYSSSMEYINYVKNQFYKEYYSIYSYLNEEKHCELFVDAIDDISKLANIKYSLRQNTYIKSYSANIIITDSNKNITLTSFSPNEMNIHRKIFNEIAIENFKKCGDDIYNTVYFFSGNNSEYIFIKDLYKEDKLCGYVSVFIDSTSIGNLFDNYQYDTIITTDNGQIIYCSEDSLLEERNNNKYIRKNRIEIVEKNNYNYFSIRKNIDEKNIIIYSFIYKSSSKVYLLIGILSIIILGLIWFIMFLKISKLMAKRASNAVDILASEMRIIRHGNSSHVIRMETGDEFEEIARQINKMLRSINELNKKNNELIRLNSTIELKNLQAQINPHFIYNTLENIKYLVSYAPERSIELIERFTSILRYSINNTKENVYIYEDMEYLMVYIYIQKIRFEDSFNCRIFIDDECNKYKTPKLLIQPLVENSIKYGFEKKTKINIDIRVFKEGDYIIFTVKDDGMGMSQENIKNLMNMVESEHIITEHNGLQNIYRRIILKYGKRSEMNIDSVEGEYFLVTLRIYCKGVE